MNRKTITLSIAATLALACALPAAQAANQNSKDRQAKIEKIKQNQRLVKQPRTMAEAAATVVRLDNGATSVMVPTELWNSLSVQKDANGNLQVRESDGNSAPVSTTTEGLENE
jgi:hypothetical protein